MDRSRSSFRQKTGRTAGAQSETVVFEALAPMEMNKGWGCMNTPVCAATAKGWIHWTAYPSPADLQGPFHRLLSKWCPSLTAAAHNTNTQKGNSEMADASREGNT